jgi:hypothetical protein
LDQSQDQADASAQKEATYTGLSVIVGSLAIMLSFFQYRIAKSSYLANRPYLIFGEVTLHNLICRKDVQGLTFTYAKVVIENAGSGPAVIRDFRGKLKILPDAMKGGFPSPGVDWGDMKDCEPIGVSRKVIAGRGDADATVIYKGNFLSDDDYKAVKMTYEQILVFYGTINYSSVTGWRRYKTTIGITYRPPGLIGEKDFFSIGPAKYNRNT